MAKVYADLIRKGVKTIDDVPEKLKATVQATLPETEYIFCLKFYCIRCIIYFFGRENINFSIMSADYPILISAWYGKAFG